MMEGTFSDYSTALNKYQIWSCGYDLHKDFCCSMCNSGSTMFFCPVPWVKASHPFT